MRGPEAYQQTELDGSCTKTAFSDPDLVDPLPLLFNDLLTPPTCRDGLANAVRLDHFHHGVPVVFLFRHVWMPPLVQDIFERFERVIGCGHVSGLFLRH